MPARRLARYLSCEKAKAIANRHKNAIIIAADTIICFNDKVLENRIMRVKRKGCLIF